MSGFLNPHCKAKLLERTKIALAQVQVASGRNLVPWSTVLLLTAEDALPDHGPLRQKLNAYVSEWPFHDFARDTLARLLRKSPFNTDVNPVMLSDVTDFADLDALSGQLVDEFDRLPWDCALTLPLPDWIGLELLIALGPTKFNSKFELVALDATHAAAYPMVSGDVELDRELSGSLLNLNPPAWPNQGAALKVRFDGFINQYSLSDVVQDVLGYIDAFFGMCIALHLLAPGRTRSPVSPKIPAYFHKIEDSRWVPVRRHDIDAMHAQFLLGLEVNKSVEKAEADTKRGNFLWVAARIREAFHDPIASRQIISASQWLFNSYTSGHGMMAFVQATVALEILLGDEKANEGIGLTELLRNRCAYLIAGTQADRDAIKKKFTEIYAVRSKIVHAGKSRLTMKDVGLLNELRQMVHRVIAKEISMLPAIPQPNAS